MSKSNFFPHTAKYNASNVLLLAKASQLAYQDEKKIEKAVESWDCTKFKFFDRKETQAFITGNKHMLIVAFRGTEPTTLRDWLTDADMDLTEGPGGKVHEGFHRALKYVWREMREILNEYQDNGQSLWFTGHSLGAALATLAVAKLGEEDKPVNGLYTFGQPRVGDRSFARNFNQDFGNIAFRFVNNNDVVTRVPPRATGFRHVGKTLYIDVDGRVQDDIHWWNQFVDRVKGRIEDLGKLGTDGIKDHSMERYIARLEKEENMKLVV